MHMRLTKATQELITKSAADLKMLATMYKINLDMNSKRYDRGLHKLGLSSLFIYRPCFFYR